MADDQRKAPHGRLDPDRESATQRYVAALRALDAAGETSKTVATSAAAAAADVVRLNQVWGQGASPDDRHPRGLAKRLVAELARLLPWRRRRLHGALIAAVNRNTETIRALIDNNDHFHSHVIRYAQTVGAIAAEVRGGADRPEGVAALQRAIGGISTDWLKHWESLEAREQRYDARMTALTKAYDDLREIASLAQQGTLSLKRTVEGIAGGDRPANPAPSTNQAHGPDTEAFKYLIFEDRFRGSREDIGRRLADYVPLFAGAGDVVDLGCGRGELLDLFRQHGIDARGIDINDEMVESCRARGLAADRADGLAFLAAQPDQSLGGLIAIQVVEHLEPNYLMNLIEAAHHKLKPGAPLVLETINAACWAAFFDSYIRDFTHVRPIHPDTLRYLVQACGFSAVDVRYLSPIAEHEKLPSVKVAHEPHADPSVVELVETVNAHSQRLNSQLFTFRDYAIVARK